MIDPRDSADGTLRLSDRMVRKPMDEVESSAVFRPSDRGGMLNSGSCPGPQLEGAVVTDILVHPKPSRHNVRKTVPHFNVL